jgi:hypothetical protein
MEAEIKMKEASVGYRRMEVMDVGYSNGIAAGDEAHREVYRLDMNQISSKHWLVV